MRTALAGAAVGLAALLLLSAGCGQPPPRGEEQRQPVITLVTDTAGVGDKGFNEICWAGLKRAERELGVAVRKIESSDPADYARNLALAAERSDLTVAHGFLLLDAVTQVSAQYPESRFLFVDGEIPGRGNVASYTFRSNEIGFLAGVLAAGVSATHKVGSLKGMNIPPTELFDIGYRAGIRCADATWGTTTEVKSLTAGDFNDPQRGKLMTEQLFADGCDVVFSLAGMTGIGALAAVRDSRMPVFIIGVDYNQDEEAPGRVLTTALKRIDVLVFRAVEELKAGRFSPGHHSIGIAESALSLTDMRHTRDRIGAAVLEAVEVARRLIAEGNLPLPGSYEEIGDFQPVALK